MYAQAAIKPNLLFRNGAYGIVMRGVHFCTRGCASLRRRYSAPLCCIKLDTATDPACGSGNFLTETYLSLRQLENEALLLITGGQITLGEVINPIKCSIQQFYGIEINDFAVTVAKTALWIAESQMMKETESIIHMNLDFLPLKTNAYIVEGNALRLDWRGIVPPHELNYIMGNPPFVGKKEQSHMQKADLAALFTKDEYSGNLDYVSGWYMKAAEYIQNTGIRCAFVSTNSITQGEQVPLLWDILLHRYGLHIDFAYRTFKWESEAKQKAAVHCVIIGFSKSINTKPKVIFSSNMVKEADNISPYLIDAPNIYVTSRKTPLFDVPEIVTGNQATDDGNFFVTAEEREKLIADNPDIEKYIRKSYNSFGFINGKYQYCLWLVGVDPAILRSNAFIILVNEIDCRIHAA